MVALNYSSLLSQADYGVELDSFLGIERTGWSYLAETTSSPQAPTLDSETTREARHVSVRPERVEEELASVSVLQWLDDGVVPTNVTTW